MKATNPVREGYHTLTPHITVKGAEAAIDFYRRAFGAEELARHVFGGMVAHAELRIGDSIVMLNDEIPAQGVFAPPENGGGTTLHIYVPDVDAAFQRAVDAGAQVVMPVVDMFWGDRYGLLKDPFGHRWSLATCNEELTPEEVAARAAQVFSGGDCGHGS